MKKKKKRNPISKLSIIYTVKSWKASTSHVPKHDSKKNLFPFVKSSSWLCSKRGFPKWRGVRKSERHLNWQVIFQSRVFRTRLLRGTHRMEDIYLVSLQKSIQTRLATNKLFFFFLFYFAEEEVGGSFSWTLFSICIISMISIICMRSGIWQDSWKWHYFVQLEILADESKLNKLSHLVVFRPTPASAIGRGSIS